MAKKLKTLHFLLLIIFLSFLVLASTIEARSFRAAPDQKPSVNEAMGQNLQLDEVTKTLDLLENKGQGTSGPSDGGIGH
ncbi:hypothetical protein SLE2022_193090 [Rubroshorea leprosula]